MGGSHKVAGKRYSNTENIQMASIGAIFTSTYHTQQLNPWPCMKFISQSCGKLQLDVCLSTGDEPFEDYLSTHGCLKSLKISNSKNNLSNLQHQYLAEILVKVYT